MAGIPPITSEPFLDAVDKALRDRVKNALKAPLMKFAEAEIDKAVEDAVEALNTHLEAYRDPMLMRDTITVLLRRSAR